MFRRFVSICIVPLLLCTGCAQQALHTHEPPVSAPQSVSAPAPDLSPVDPEPANAPAVLPAQPPEPQAPPELEVPAEPEAPTETEAPAEAEPPVQPDVPAETETQAESPAESDLADKPAGYDFTVPVPESPAVENDYFADAAFVGDSRTEGFYLFSGVKQGKKLTCDGLSVFTLARKKAIHLNGGSYTLLEALALQPYAKVYLCLGVNELGYRDDAAFYKAYCDAIDAVRACQPNAVLYVQTLPPLNEGKIAASGGFGYLKNDRLRTFNALICRAAAEKQVPVLDLYTLFAVDGQLPADASRDGVHLLPPYCKMQLEYFRTHTVDYAALYPAPTEEPSPTPDIPEEVPTP